MKLEIKKVTKKYGSKAVVDNLSLSLDNGVCALLGANGSGKTTLMRMIAGVLTPTNGEILLDNQNITRLDAAYRNIIGYLPQNFGYYKDFTAGEFLEYISALKGIDNNYAEKRCDEMLGYVGLSEQKKKKIKTFSGGMRQRLGIAQALLNNPSILILDEPTAGLDPKERIKFRNLLSEVAENKIIIYATHIVSDISFIAGRTVIMKDGGIAADGTPQQLLSQMKGKVWLVETQRERINDFQSKYTVGDIVALENGNVRLRVISDKAFSHEACEAQPELDDVYLHYFGEAAQNEKNDCI